MSGLRAWIIVRILNMSSPVIAIHPSVEPANLERQAIASLRANRIDPRFLYITPRQTALWRQVFLSHSPVHRNPEFRRVYSDAFDQLAATLTDKSIHLVGLGSGTGLKERELFLRLKAAGIDAGFSAVDVSRTLVEEAAQTLREAGARSGPSLACDLGETESLAQWLRQVDAGLPRVFTLFGLVPNLLPTEVSRLIRAVLRPGDLLLVNAHLAPVDESLNLEGAMLRVLPQYDQAETLTWLAAGVEQWGLENLVEPPRMIIGEIEGVPAFVALAAWKNNHPFERWGHQFTPDLHEPLQVFRSLRYTPSKFEEFLREANLSSERLAMTACGEEAIWLVRG